MEQQRALNALEPYIALSKSATSPRAAADLITQATSAPQTYVFAELLHTPNVQALSKSVEYKPYLTLLEIFAWGTFHEYNLTQGLPSLTLAQSNKLQILSFLSLCTSPTLLDYTSLRERLSLQTDRELEALITTVVYENLVKGYLDPQHRRVQISSIAPIRDLPPNSVPRLLEVLGEWEDRCTQTLANIETRIEAINQRSYEAKRVNAQLEQQFEDALNGKNEEERLDTSEDATESETADEGNTTSKIKGLASAIFGKSGKRAAPTTLEAGDSDYVDEDAMDLDDGTFGQGTSRGAKRQGRSLGLR